MSIGKHFTCEVLTVDKTEALKAAAQMMFDKNTGSLVVVEDENPVGMLTDRDIAECLVKEEQNIANLKVADAMNTDLLEVRTTDGIQDTLEAMAEKGVRRAPVVNEQGKLVGLVTADDVIKVLADEFSKLSEIVHQQASVMH